MNTERFYAPLLVSIWISAEDAKAGFAMEVALVEGMYLTEDIVSGATREVDAI